MSARPALIVRMTPDRPVAIDYRSASMVSRLLATRPADEVPGLLSSLFAVCPSAQRLAGELALAGASGIRLPAERRRLLVRAARLEALREHGLRVLLGWPRALRERSNEAVAGQWLAATRAGRAEEIARLAERAILGCSPLRWLDQSPSDLVAWAQAGVTSAARFLARAMAMVSVPPCPAGAGPGLAGRLRDHALMDGFAEGSLAQHHAARLVDLAWHITTLLQLGRRSGEHRVRRCDRGASVRAFTSRGELVHRVRLRGGKVECYSITSPTDRTFANDGIARSWLEALAAAPCARNEAAVGEVLQALDPCVEYRIEVI